MYVHSSIERFEILWCCTAFNEFAFNFWLCEITTFAVLSCSTVDCCFWYLVSVKPSLMSFLEVDYTGSSLSVCGPQDIVSRLNLPKGHFTVKPFNDFTKVVISGQFSNVPLDVIYLAIYSRASSLVWDHR
ncbi:hypothetical protein ECG_03177 [Echinococcus granulosus]|nr:hypothetical protein ECG_03177 [Echinococcus granulosus]